MNWTIYWTIHECWTENIGQDEQNTLYLQGFYDGNISVTKWHFLDMEGVAGSSPATPTTFYPSKMTVSANVYGHDLDTIIFSCFTVQLWETVRKTGRHLPNKAPNILAKFLYIPLSEGVLSSCFRPAKQNSIGLFQTTTQLKHTTAQYMTAAFTLPVRLNSSTSRNSRWQSMRE